MTMKKILTSAAIALTLAVAGVGVAGCTGSATPAEPTGPRMIRVGDASVKVVCSGNSVQNQPAVILLHGGGDDLTTMADFQETVSANHRVCSYDRLGAGASDKPDGPQDYDDIGDTLTGVLDQIVGDRPVVLVGHSMGGLIAARYAPVEDRRVS